MGRRFKLLGPAGSAVEILVGCRSIAGALVPCDSGPRLQGSSAVTGNRIASTGRPMRAFSMPAPRVERRHDPAAVERLLRRLPAWFGIEEAIAAYAEAAARLPCYLALVGETVVGVALIERHFPESAELHLIAVDPEQRGSGVGSALLELIEDDLRVDGAQMLQVHTVGPSFDDTAYAETRAFYQALDFVPLFEAEGLDWDGPTLVLAKSLG